MGGTGAVLEDELELARESRDSARSVILVEGQSDRRALETLAARLDRDLVAERVAILAIAGASNVGRFLAILPAEVQVCGLYDEAEEHVVRNALEQGDGSTGHELAAQGFFMCRRDLEEELIRSVGIAGVLETVEDTRDLEAWRRFSNQPAQRGRSIEARLRRFLGTKSGRKIEYAGLLAARIDLAQSDSPLLMVLAHTR